ncbi:MAG: hypothetical protein J7485_14865, partial [Sphingobium sp.]|nr:hypothetical protein [Sphingobium sp.]
MFAYGSRGVIEGLGRVETKVKEDMMRDKVNDPLRRNRALAACVLALTFLAHGPVIAANKPPPVIVAPKPTYARLSDLVIASPAIAVVSVKKMTQVPAERAQGLAPGNQRFLVAADTLSLIRSNDVLARQAS